MKSIFSLTYYDGKAYTYYLDLCGLFEGPCDYNGNSSEGAVLCQGFSKNPDQWFNLGNRSHLEIKSDDGMMTCGREW